MHKPCEERCLQNFREVGKNRPFQFHKSVWYRHHNCISVMEQNCLQMKPHKRRCLPLWSGNKGSWSHHGLQNTFLSFSSEQFHCLFLILGTVPEGLRVPAQHFLENIYPVSEVELTNHGLSLRTGAPRRRKSSLQQWLCRAVWWPPHTYPGKPNPLPAMVGTDGQSSLSACSGRGAQREGGSSPPGIKSHLPTWPATFSALGAGEVGTGGRRERSRLGLLGDVSPRKGERSSHPCLISHIDIETVMFHRLKIHYLSRGGYLSAILDFLQDFCKWTEKI